MYVYIRCWSCVCVCVCQHEHGVFFAFKITKFKHYFLCPVHESAKLTGARRNPAHSCHGSSPSLKPQGSRLHPSLPLIVAP